MASGSGGWLPAWSLATPFAAAAVLAAAMLGPSSAIVLAIAAAALVAAVLAAVHHAEVIAHRVGEPFGTLVLALAVTLIEGSLIVSMMLSGGAEASALARDTVFATVMIICNGVIGLCILAGSLRHHVVEFRVEGTVPAVAVLATLTTTALILPDLTLAAEGPKFSVSQLAFAGVVSLLLYGVFVFVQTVRHRDYFLQPGGGEHAHAAPPANRIALASLGLLLVSLVGVVGLAKTLAPSVESAVDAAGFPRAVVGIVIALVVLMPETLSALRAARADRLQTSLNLALGSGLATIGLTIPAVAATSIALGLPLDLGLPPTEVALLALTLLLTAMTAAGGRATILQGAVHLIVFAIYVFLAMVP